MPERSRLVLVQEFEKPIRTSQMDRPSKTFYWSIEPGRTGRDGRGEFERVGSWGANNWFHVAKGRTAKATLGNARRRLGALARNAGERCTFRYEVD